MPNRLAKEKSPYLLQHANNPVDWYPWTDEAFARAAAEDKPLFLSVGYSTCHWCHVMEHESFQDMEVADLLNTAFICIKVDREERPDIDALYMTVCSMMTGRGGWPLTIIMTPDRKPFFAGTYFAKHSGFGRIGMLDLVERIKEIWCNRRDEVKKSADSIVDLLQQQNRSVPGPDLDESIFHAAFAELSKRYDPAYGGFSSPPKFPTPHIVTFLLRYWKMTGNDHVLTMVEKTLTAMRLGGIYDHIGFGFHRYSTDGKWLLPHFEKMLYDQALLAAAYTETYQVTGTPLFKQTAQEIFSYVLRDMTAPEGGFYSAEDADSEGIEGKFYVWTISELRQVLAPRELDLVRDLYNVRTGGNFHEEATGIQTEANIFYLSSPLPDMLDDSFTDMKKRDGLAAVREKLFSAREKRIHPLKDDKILADWNGLMIGSLAIGARIFGNHQYLEAAKKAAAFILSAMCDRNGKLLHRYRDGNSAITGMLCDYAFLVWGLLELYAAGFDHNILQKAILLNDRMLELFWDEKSGGFFLTPNDGEALLVRPKEIYDGALPSGNSIALSNLIRLERLTANTELGHKAKLLVQAFSETLKETPSAYTQFLVGLNFALSPATDIVLVGEIHANDTREMLTIIREKFSPGITCLLKEPSTPADQLAVLAPFSAQYTALDGKATAYVCRDNSCDSPTNDPAHLKKILLP
jgi:uncharacterized protein YyaL (SSP411 family)